MKIKRLINAGVVTVLLGLSSQAWSASVSYVLDQSNLLADGNDYMKVTVMDNNAGDGVDIWVETLPGLAQEACEVAGIKGFSFDLVGGVSLQGSKSHGWGHKHRHGGWMMGHRGGHGDHRYGRGMEHAGAGGKTISARDFDLPDYWFVSRRGHGRQDVSLYNYGFHKNPDDALALHFSINGLSVDDIGDHFTAYVVGRFEMPGHGCMGDGDVRCRKAIVKIYGDRVMNPVPVPAAAWLFGSGLLGLVGVARRRRLQ